MTADLREVLRPDDSTPMDGHAVGPTHIRLADGAVVTIETWQAIQRRNLERSDPPPPAPQPRPDRPELEAKLADARQRRDETAAKRAKADAALEKAVALADAAKRALEVVDAEIAARAESYTDKIRDWIAGGGVGERPRAKRLTHDETERRQAAEAELRGANGAITALEFELGEAQRHADAALADLHAAAREILAADAGDLAARIDALESESAALWQELWGFAFASPGATAMVLDPLTRQIVASPPRKTNRATTPLARRTAEGQRAIERARARFNALVAGLNAGD